ncbi:hypothetical protein PYCCODRAFT_971803 [Trametes coccinea BRFM310]|uniref:Uncharacterized protein n=1 Tax=Trametes coccinea (strain BRFM310) TaxID=1353009 RepID=A0A1Y2IBQ1_TRAC3|nr:hypothetical protein PYCCODRAFT_971803 [Trametes coccinea BRFM310]
MPRREFLSLPPGVTAAHSPAQCTRARGSFLRYGRPLRRMGTVDGDRWCPHDRCMAVTACRGIWSSLREPHSPRREAPVLQYQSRIRSNRLRPPLCPRIPSFDKLD